MYFQKLHFVTSQSSSQCFTSSGLGSFAKLAMPSKGGFIRYYVSAQGRQYADEFSDWLLKEIRNKTYIVQQSSCMCTCYCTWLRISASLLGMVICMLDLFAFGGAYYCHPKWSHLGIQCMHRLQKKSLCKLYGLLLFLLKIENMVGKSGLS